MLVAALAPVALCAVAVLFVFTLRRLVLLLGALLPPRRESAGDAPPSVTLVVAARNEMSGIERTLDALSRLAYPSECLSVVLVNDASDDRTGERLAAWAAGRANARAVDLAERV